MTNCRIGLAATALAVAVCAAGLLAQTPSFRLVGTKGVVKARVERLGFIAGPVLARLKDGRSMQVHLDLTIATAPDDSPLAVAKGVFQVSYDLWEERFAATMAGAAPRSASHLTPAGSEAWCLDQLGIPEDALKAAGRGTLFAQVTYITRDEDELASRQRGDALSLRGLIDRLSRRGSDNEWRGSVQSGNLRLE